MIFRFLIGGLQSPSSWYSPADFHQIRLFHVLMCLMILAVMVPGRGLAQSIVSPQFAFTGVVSPYYLPIFYKREPLEGNGVKLGPALVHPHLGIAQLASDNVFASKKNRRSDTLTLIAPGIQAYLPFFERHFLLLDYRAAQRYNYRFPENDALNQEAVGRMSFSFPGGLNLNLQGGHTEGFDARGSELDIQQRDLTTWHTNFFFGEAEYLGSRTGAQIQIRSIKYDYENNGQGVPRDLFTNSVSFTTFLRAATRQRSYALLGVILENATYDDNKQLDSFSYTLNAGFRLPVSDRLTGEMTAGVTVLNFDRAPLPEGSLPPGSPLSLGGDGQKRFFLNGNINWQPTSRFSVTFRPFRRISQAAIFTSSTFTQTGGYLSAIQKLGNRMALTGVAYYTNNNFSGETKRVDNLYRLTAGLQYKTVQWLGIKLQYIFQGRSSNENRFDYYSNGLMISIQGLL